jgi:undecaprenyl pyrophosphate synthase
MFQSIPKHMAADYSWDLFIITGARSLSGFLSWLFAPEHVG